MLRYIPGQITLASLKMLLQTGAFGSTEHLNMSSSVPLQFKPLKNVG